VGFVLAGMLSIALLATGALRPAHVSGSALLLPNLVADPPDNVSLTTDSSTGTNRLLLRFNGYVHNRGPGALDFRGSREKPKVSQKIEEEVERAREHEESLPQKTEEELVSPPMKVFQRLFTTNAEETNIERPHSDEPSSGEMIYVSADGHHHWHLQRVAKYSLWDSAKIAEVAPALKVGFCLEDSQHVETNIGPGQAVYADNVFPYRDFCQQYRPNATDLYEGISPGWRDVYSRELAFQWVDASNVLPGEYWLREDVNPLGVIIETDGANTPAYATSPTIIPGFDALAQTTSTQVGEAKTVTLSSKAWSDSATPKYTIVSQPQHGKLGAVSNNQVTYTPNAGYSGPDSFTFSVADPNSPFPASPAVATVSVEVSAPPPPSVSIGGAPSSMMVGASVLLTATVANDSGGVEWIASAGTVTPEGSEGLKNIYKAPSEPPPGGTVTVTAHLRDDPSVSDQRTITIVPTVSPSVSIGGAPSSMTAGTGVQLVATVSHDSGGVEWSASSGIVTPEGLESAYTAPLEPLPGATVTITARLKDNRGVTDQRTITIVPAPQPSVSIATAPSSVSAGTSASLTATVSHDSGGVEWIASAGTITQEGSEGLESTYQAPTEPPLGGAVTVTVRLQDDRAISDERTITIKPVHPAEPAPELPSPPNAGTVSTSGSLQSPASGSGTSPASGSGTSSTSGSGGVEGFKSKAVAASVSRPSAMLVGRMLVMSTVPSAAGRVRLTAYIGRRELGTCVAQTPAGRAFTCRIRLARRISLRAHISVRASLRVGELLLQAVLPAQRIPKMKMRPVGPIARTASASGVFWCSPSTLTGVLVGGVSRR
jgi:hypothetical protein